MSSTTSFPIQSRVVIQHLVNGAQYNGQIGAVISTIDPSTLRQNVLVASNKTLSIKPKNLRQAPPHLVWWDGWARNKEPCFHGCKVLPPKNHPVYKFMDNWTKKSRTRPFMKAYPLMEQMLEEHVEIWNTEAMKKMVMDIMISIGVNLILDDKTQAGDIELIRGCGICIVLLENYESRSDNNSLCPATYRGAAEMRDLNGGSERDIIKFYLKRIPCSCLKEMHSEAKKTQSKQGICSYCKQKKDRESASRYCRPTTEVM